MRSVVRVHSSPCTLKKDRGFITKLYVASRNAEHCSITCRYVISRRIKEHLQVCLDLSYIQCLATYTLYLENCIHQTNHIQDEKTLKIEDKTSVMNAKREAKRIYHKNRMYQTIHKREKACRYNAIYRQGQKGQAIRAQGGCLGTRSR